MVGPATGTARLPAGAVGRRGVTELMYAAQQGDANRVKAIIHQQPTSLYAVDRSGHSPLHYCTTSESVRASHAADILVMAAPELVESRDEEGFTPLHLAVIAGNMSLVTFLLANHADVNALDNEQHTVVHWATVCGEEAALRAVLEAGAPVSTPDLHGGYPLHYAAQMCGGTDKETTFAIPILSTLLSHPECQISVQDGDGRQPLLWAASAGSARAVLALVRAGAAVEAPDKDGLTALHCAASRGHTDTLDTLLTLCGASTDYIDSNGCTALHYAVTLGHADATALLLSHGADPNRQDRKGRTPAHCGCAKGQVETVRLLAAHGANLWARTARGDLPLHEAAASGRRELVKWLLEMRPGQVNARNSDGRTPLHCAAMHDNADMAKILLDVGAQVNPVLRTSKNIFMTPLDCALQRGFRSTAKYLQLHGGMPASKLSDLKHKGDSVSMQVRDDVTFWGDTSSDSERENGDKEKRTKKIMRRKLAYKYDKRRLSASGSDIENQSANAKRRSSRNSFEERLKSHRVDKKKDIESVRISSRKSSSGVLDYSNEIVFNGNSGVNIHQSSEIRISSGTGEDITRLAESSLQVPQKLTTISSERKNSPSEKEKRPRSAKYKISGKATKPTNCKMNKEKNLNEHESEIKESTKTLRSDQTPKPVLRDQSTNTTNEGIITTNVEHGSSQGIESEKVDKNQMIPQMTLNETHTQDNTHLNQSKKLLDEQSLLSNTSEEVEETKLMVVEAAIHEPPKLNNGESVTDALAEKIGQAANPAAIISHEQTQTSASNIKENSREERISESTMSVSQTAHEESSITNTDEGGINSNNGNQDEIVEKQLSRVGNLSNNDAASKSIPTEENNIEKDGKASTGTNDGIKDINIDKNLFTKDGVPTPDAEKIPDTNEEEITKNNEAVTKSEISSAKKKEDLAFEVLDATAVLEEGASYEKSTSHSDNEKNVQNLEEKNNNIQSNGETKKIGKRKSDSSNKALNEAKETKLSERETAQEKISKKVEKKKHPKEKKVSGTKDGSEKPARLKLVSPENDKSIDKKLKTKIDLHDEAEVENEDEEKSSIGEASVDNSDASDALSSSSARTHKSFRVLEDEKATKSFRILQDEEAEILTNEQKMEKSRIAKLQKQRSRSEETKATKEAFNEDLKKSKIPRRLTKSYISTSDKQLYKPEKVAFNLEAGYPSLPNINNIHHPKQKFSKQLEVPSAYSDNERSGSDYEDLRRSSSLRRRKLKRRVKTRESKSAGSDYESSNLIDSGFEPSPRSSRIPKWRNMSERGVNMTSVTQSIQTNIRRYHIERKIFEHLLELKRLQIRSGQHNEAVLVKRAIDSYHQSCASTVGAGKYHPQDLTFRSFEQFLYHALRRLQRDGADHLKGLPEAPVNPLHCTLSTNRCMHATHAYTGIPCAAYLPKMDHHTIPKIGYMTACKPGTGPSFLPTIDPKKAVTLELCHGREKQVITLPADRLDQNKRYYVTFTVKGTDTEKVHKEPTECDVQQHQHPRSD